ncbi:MAG TPA: IPT/TIG domain-containing protein [Vicinamibacterales bacterium]|nr:IPT/TIG domain-containing protein [Vicinamibacterales bacterium]
MTSATTSRITGVRPLWGVEGSWLTISGDGFSVDPPPEVKIGALPARVVAASSRELRVTVPAALEGGRTPVRIESAPGETVFVEIGAPIATGLHQVDSPVFDRTGNLFVTFSGSRGQEVPVSIYVVRPDGSREPFVSGLPNPTSMAFDPSGQLHVSSRFDGSVYRIDADGSATQVATDLGVACGIAFDADGVLFVGDRSGTIFRVDDSRAVMVATLPPSVAAFHLAFDAAGSLFVTGPTLGTRDSIYRVDPDGRVSVFHEGLGRPQGMAVDQAGRLYVADALAGSGGLYRFGAGGGDPEVLLAAGGLVGLAFGPAGTMAVCSADTVYRLDAGIDGLLPFTRR